VIPDLRSIVVNATAGLFDNVFQSHILKISAFLQVVEIDYIRIVVLAMVEFQGFFGIVRRQSVNGERQGGQSVFHRILKSEVTKRQIVESFKRTG
jgi:hypothetical protein